MHHLTISLSLSLHSTVDRLIFVGGRHLQYIIHSFGLFLSVFLLFNIFSFALVFLLFFFVGSFVRLSPRMCRTGFLAGRDIGSNLVFCLTLFRSDISSIPSFSGRERNGGGRRRRRRGQDSSSLFFSFHFVTSSILFYPNSALLCLSFCP